VYWALSGRLPFEGKTLESFLINKSTQEPIALEGIAEGIPPACAAAVMRGLERDARRRFPSCASFSEAFAAGVESAVPADAQPRLGRWLALAAAAGLALALLWTIGSDEEPAEQAMLEPADAVRDEADTETRDEPGMETQLLGDAGAREAPVFLAGSTEEEIDAALRLCQRYQGEGMCERAWYTSERSHPFVATSIEMDRTEVTNLQFSEFALATGHVTRAERTGESRDGPIVTRDLSWRAPYANADFETLLDVPVVHVDVADARAYCAWRGARLPSPDEWEFVARGRERRVFPWGDEWDEARATWWSEPRPGPLRTDANRLGATPGGHLGMAGNVWEWTLSATGDALLKGGSYLERNPANLRAAASSEVDPSYTASDAGFRCVRDLDGAGRDASEPLRSRLEG
jgi:formylglycine-generating enzyme required for sulfatase activity